jgi:hypothetical protein
MLCHTIWLCSQLVQSLFIFIISAAIKMVWYYNDIESIELKILIVIAYHGLDEFGIDVVPYLEQVSLLLGGGHVVSHSRVYKTVE